MSIPALLALVLAAAPASAASAATQAAPRKPRPAAVRAARRAAGKKETPAAAATKTPPAAAPAASPAPAAAVSAPAPARDEAVLAGLGAALNEDQDGLVAEDAWPGRPAAGMGLRAGDRVWFVDRASTRRRSEAAAARRATAPEERESVIVRRGLETVALTGAESPAPPDFVRGSQDLSAREKNLADARSARDASAARDAVAEAAPLDWSLRADQAFWVRFPGGLKTAAKNDVVEAQVATGLTTDGSLDFLAVPPKSRAWARVVSVSDDGSVRTIRLAFFKLRPAGGSMYPILGAVTAVAGVPASDLARVSAGGSLVSASPLPPADGSRKRGADLLLDDAARLRVRLLEPAALTEPAPWWRAGPGLWLKTDLDATGRRRFLITHVVAERAAAAAGLKVGDAIEAIAGRAAEKIDFEDALDALYGAPGSTVKLTISGAAGPKVVELARGVKVDAKGKAAPLPLPFER